MTRFTRLFIFLLLLHFTGCIKSVSRSGSEIRIKGSDTMIILVKTFAEAYMTTHPDVKIAVQGGGSATGFEALINGETDIAMASRLITPVEASKIAKAYKNIGISYLVAKDALSIYLNPANKINSLTMGDLALIFSGQIDNWLVFSDSLVDIMPVIRPETSGTHLYFRSHVLMGEPFAQKSLVLPTTSAVTRYVADNFNAIGYGGFAYGDSVYMAPVNGISPNEENVRNDSYPLSRYLYFYTITTPDETIRKFIDWVISPAGQAIVRQTGYFAIW
jgi:phosphate transport system substrate-binding protein